MELGQLGKDGHFAHNHAAKVSKYGIEGVTTRHPKMVANIAMDFRMTR